MAAQERFLDVVQRYTAISRIDRIEKIFPRCVDKPIAEGS